jgi:O-antigen/teichoic acid export membrane protein
MSGSAHIKVTFKHAVIYSLSGILEKAVGFIMLPFYAYMLGAEVYGILQMIEVVVTVLQILAGYAMASALNRFYFERKTEKQRHILVSTSVLTMFFLTTLVCIPALLLKKPIGLLAFGKEGFEYYIVLGILTFFAETTAVNAQTYILQRQKPVFFSVLSFARFALGLGLNIYLIIYLRLGVLGVLYSGLITGIAFSLSVHLYTLLSTGLHFNADDAKAILKYVLPLLPGHTATFIRSNTDRIVLRSYMGLAQLGVYSTVLKFAMLLGVVLHEPFMKIWAVKRMEIADTPEGMRTISRMVTLYLALSLFLGLLLSLEIPLCIELLTPKEFWVSGLVAFFAVTSRIGFNAYYHFYFGLLYGKATAMISTVLAISAVINFAVSIVFIKYYGIMGAYLAATLVYFIQCVITHFMAQKYYRVEYEWRKITMMTLSATILFLLIDRFSIRQLQWDVWLNLHILPFCTDVLRVLHLDTFKGGKIMALLSQKFPIVVEGAIKALLSLAFLPSLSLFGIIRRETVAEVVRKTAQRFGFRRLCLISDKAGIE